MEQLLAFQGKNYRTPKKTKDSPWAFQNRETCIPIFAKVNSLQIPGERHIEFESAFTHNGTTVNKVFAFEQDFMHLLTWYWDKQEVTANYSPGMEIPCLVSSENPNRHFIWTHY